MSDGWIGVDLDGTLAFYDKWRGETHIGEPIAPMVERVKRWVSQGRKVKIFTARVSARNDDEVAAVRSAVAAWLAKNGLPLLEITCTKDYAMIELWDDRAVTVQMNTGRQLAGSSRGLGDDDTQTVPLTILKP